MTTLLTLLPGDIPGLLRRGSPCRIDKWPDYVAVAAPDGGAVRLAAARGARIDSFGLALVALDLTDPTGADHAARWLAGRVRIADLTADERVALWVVTVGCFDGEEATLAQIDTLARLVLRLSGRTA